MESIKRLELLTALLAVLFGLPVLSAIVGNNPELEDFCASMPCGHGNACFNTPIGHKCFCRSDDQSYECNKEEHCLLFNHTGVCRSQCIDGEVGFYISHLGGKFMNLRVYNKDGNELIQKEVPVGDIKEQSPCMWQLTGNADCCVPMDEVKLGCFAFGGKVLTENRGVVSIEDIKTGDRVQSVKGEGEPGFSDVIMIMHQEPEREEDMVTIVASTGDELTLTHDHLVLVSDDGDSWRYAFSEKAAPGQLIKVVLDGHPMTVDIEAIERTTKKGLYAPVTLSGTIVVDNVVASCYGNHPDHSLSHLVFTPIRWLYKWLPATYDGDAVNEDGSHPYVSFLNKHLRSLTGYSLVLTQNRLDGHTTLQ